MFALQIFLVMLAILPLRNLKDYQTRWDLAVGITRANSDITRQIVLARIARFESGFDPRVGRCEIKGKDGELGYFQIKPIRPRDAKLACGTTIQQAALANEYVERSIAACPNNSEADSLAMYVSGTCQKGIVQAKHRWVNESDKASLFPVSNEPVEPVSEVEALPLAP